MNDSTANLAITEWIREFHAGQPGAAAKLYEHYYPRLVRVATRAIGNTPRRWWDEEDVVSKAFASFFHRSQEGRFHVAMDRNELWRLLATITRRKTMNQIRDQKSQRRGGANQPLSDAELEACNTSLAEVCRNDESPEDIVENAERHVRALATLDPDLAEVALNKLMGYTNVEIAAKINRSVPTVERRLRLIREKWTSEELR